MSILAWLFRRTPGETDPAPPIKTKTGEITPIVGSDKTVSIESAPAVAIRYTLDPFFWMIEYEDSQGDITRRRVTMRCVEERGGKQYLFAFCHERSALRMFRLDRIGCLISPDGEVEDADAWFTAMLATCEPTEFVAEQRPTRAARPKADLSSYTTLKRYIAPGVTLLVAAARSDGFLHRREIDHILRFAEDSAFDLRDSGALPNGVDSADFDKLERTLTRLRPMTSDIDLALAEISKWPKDRTKHLFSALAATARADGAVDEIEAGIIDALRDFGTRHHGMGWEE